MLCAGSEAKRFMNHAVAAGDAGKRSAPSRGLYRPDEFRDNCGFGLIAHIEGEASHRLLQTAIESLTCMTHRGGIAADGRTGDGCGLLLQMPDAFMRAEAKAVLDVDLGEHYAVGMLFLSRDEALQEASREAMEAALTAEGLPVFGWREVPIDESVCGEIALDQLPRIEQVFVDASGVDHEHCVGKLFTARRRAEMALASDPDFSICSLSDRVVSYKGLVMPADLERFYPDLNNPSLETAICVFHQRFSTNTLPRWPLAQPFRMLAHNGEINTIEGNRSWSRARSARLDSPLLPDLQALTPLVNTEGSDSSSLDNMLELLTTGGVELPRALRMLIPPAWQNIEGIDPDLKAFYQYNAMHMEPWDGPAGIVLTDGRYACCLLDRNGLRPARWVTTDDGFITLASEVGTHGYQPEQVIAKGRVGPGQILVVDTQEGKVLHTKDIDELLKTRQPYKKWLRDNARLIEGSYAGEPVAAISGAELDVYQKMFQVSFEERDQVLRPLAESGNEAVGSMGDDTPMAVLSRQERSLYDYFRQKFAQVTNPPIDPLRESIVMSLEVDLGPERNIFEESADHARRISLTSPVLSQSKFKSIAGLSEEGFTAVTVDATYDPADANLRQALEAVCSSAEAAVREGKTILILSDRNIGENRVPLHSLLATGAVHHHLIRVGLRAECNLVVESGSARDSHHVACLLGFGATAVHPYLAYSVIEDLLARGELLGDPQLCQKNFRKGINKGLLKIMSKMGISAVNSYRGAQLFEAVGLDIELVDIAFTGVTSRIGGVTLDQLEKDQWQVASRARSRRKSLDQGGLLKYVHGGEYHAYNPDVVMSLQAAVVSGDYADYQQYASHCNDRPVAALRDLFTLKLPDTSVPLAEVEPIDNILRRFDSAGMSLGALSPEAHEALAMGMNQIGARSNSGEGGEDPNRFGTDRVPR
ncbi:MAG: hypothetical protein CM15mP103_01240 [Gammaproteobacteria bacterium]|nr:MAG: hypothetical protein CM15mP103_01240 [Gammaproteobacteria bacterium]